MGIFKKIVGTVVGTNNKNDAKIEKLHYKERKAASKEAKKEAKAEEKRNKEIEFRNSVRNSIVYTHSIINKVNDKIAFLENEINSLTENRTKKASSLQAKNKKIVDKDFAYLYLTQDYFTIANHFMAGLDVKKHEMIFIIKFVRYFDGEDVLTKKEEDDSVRAAFKEVASEFKEAFTGSKNDPSSYEGMLEKHKDHIKNMEIPNIKQLIDYFMKLDFGQEEELVEEENDDTCDQESIVCPNCNSSIPLGSKFCPECGSKIEIAPKKRFCTECGGQLPDGVKFCPECGHKVE